MSNIGEPSIFTRKLVITESLATGHISAIQEALCDALRQQLADDLRGFDDATLIAAAQNKPSTCVPALGEGFLYRLALAVQPSDFNPISVRLIPQGKKDYSINEFSWDQYVGAQVVITFKRTPSAEIVARPVHIPKPLPIDTSQLINIASTILGQARLLADLIQHFEVPQALQSGPLPSGTEILAIVDTISGPLAQIWLAGHRLKAAETLSNQDSTNA